MYLTLTFDLSVKREKYLCRALLLDKSVLVIINISWHVVDIHVSV